MENILHAQEQLNVLCDNTMNQVIEFALSTIDNDVCHVKLMLKEDNRA